MLSEKPPRFPARIEIRAPLALSVALEQAANCELTSTSAYARKAIINQLRADGIAVMPIDGAEARV
jgi:hypothetical protein